mgnify:CR=1 FL=1
MAGEWIKDDKFVKEKYDTTSNTNKHFKQMFPTYESFCESVHPALKKQESAPANKEGGDKQ